eukprot:1055809-Prymnesium_polylepis.1
MYSSIDAGRHNPTVWCRGRYSPRPTLHRLIREGEVWSAPPHTSARFRHAHSPEKPRKGADALVGVLARVLPSLC